MKEEWLFPNAGVPIDTQTTLALLVENKRLIDVVGGMALAQPDTDMAYTIALQRAIEWHCEGKDVPPDVAELCPYHAEKLNKTLAQPAQGATDIAALVEGMEVSVDVSTSEHDSGNRLFGKVTLAQENQGSKHGLILLVQDPEPNFKLPLPEQDGKCKYCTAGCPACDARKLPAQEPHNFCPRCAKRLWGVLGQPQIHTCTPPLWGYK